MKKPLLSLVPAVVALIAIQIGLAPSATAQTDSATKPITIDRSMDRVELISRTSRLLIFEYNIPELVVDNQNVVRATPIAANQVLLTALKPGIATITLNDENKRTQTLNVLVTGDVRTLEMILAQQFPHSRIRATALETGVLLSGTLSRADQVPTVLAVANEYFPTVHNNLMLPNSQLIAIEVQIYEVARTKVRELGIDWQIVTDNVDLVVAGGGNIENTIAFSVFDNGNRFDAFLQALERRNLARLMDKPTLVTMNGRPAEFLEGGELPFEINQGLGNTTIEFKPFGTKLDVVPIVQGEGTIRLEVRAEVSEPSADLSNNSGTSGFRVRRVNTGVDMKIGHTLVLAGDIREETESEVRGIPHLMNMPYVGSWFRRVTEEKQEIELVIMMTPRFIGEMDPALLPLGGPGRNSVSPSDCQLYHKGYIEVPRCNQDCGNLPHQPQDPIPGQLYPAAPLFPFTKSLPDNVTPATGTGPNAIPASGPIPGATSQTNQPNAYRISSMDWVQDPTRVEAPPKLASGFGYPDKNARKPVQSGGQQPRSASNFSLKNVFKR